MIRALEEGAERLARMLNTESSAVKDHSRFVSITFDDGLAEGARKAVRMLERVRARGTFYIVTG